MASSDEADDMDAVTSRRGKYGVDEDSEALLGHSYHRTDQAVEYEDALSQTGYGRFHWGVLLLCGWAVSSDAIEVLSISFILPPAGCDLHLSTLDKGTLNSIIFVGMMIGGYSWGALGDIYGRRQMLMFSLFLNGLGGLGSSFAQDYRLFLFLRLLSGIGVGGSQPLIFSYFVEFQPKNRRGAMVSVLASFWVSGNIIAAGLAWAIIPQTGLSFHAAGFSYNSWRVYIAVCTIPAFSGALLYTCMPESPKFLLEAGYHDRCINVLRRVYASNTRRDASSYPVFSLARAKSHQPITGQDRDHVGRVRNCCSKISVMVQKLGIKTGRLFSRRLLRTTLTTIYIYATLSFGYYGLFMWLPELFSRMAAHGGSACDTGFANSSLAPTVSPINGSCVMDQSNKVYLEGFITALSTMPGNILAVFIMDRVGGRLMLALGMGASGLCVFFLWFVHNELEGFILSCIFSGVANIGWVALDVVAVEIFPTDVRATSMGVTQITARTSGILGNLAFGALVNTNCAVPMMLVVFFLASGGLAALLLPNKTLQNLD